MKKIHRDNAKRIDFLDERFYTIDNETFYPSVTHVLDIYPKGAFFKQWLMDVGMNANQIRDRAADEGSKVHNAIDSFLLGGEIKWGDGYNFIEWFMVCKFMDFYNSFNPEIIASELMLFSDDHKIGGTVDLICKIDGDVWLIDYKSSNAIQKTHAIQVSTYAKVYNELYPNDPITRIGILHLKAQTRGADKQGKKIQGKGWQIKEPDRGIDHYFGVFQHLRAIWDEENPSYKPKNLSYPDRFKL